MSVEQEICLAELDGHVVAKVITGKSRQDHYGLSGLPAVGDLKTTRLATRADRLNPHPEAAGSVMLGRILQYYHIPAIKEELVYEYLKDIL